MSYKEIPDSVWQIERGIMDFIRPAIINVSLFFESINWNELFSPILSLLGIIISACVLLATVKALREQNRPFISCSIEPIKEIDHLYLIIRNTGNRTANNVGITTNPKLVSEFSKLRDFPIGLSDRGELKLSGVAPNQIIQSFFDIGYFRWVESKDKVVDIFELTIRYNYKKREFIEQTTIDFSYLKYPLESSKSDDIKPNIKKIADSLVNISKKIKV